MSKTDNLADLLKTTKTKSTNSNQTNMLANKISEIDQFDKADKIMNKVTGEETQIQPKDKIKYVTYAIPESYSTLVDQLTRKCMREEIDINKSEIIRLGIQLVNELPMEELIARLDKVKLAKGRGRK